jgi:aminoglycoside phosphotransferase (APT) family kinase protein
MTAATGVHLVPVRAAHRIDEPALAGYLRPLLPGFEGGFRIEQFQGGQSNPTYCLTTPAGRYVLRKKPPGTLLASAHAVDREFRVMRALAGSDVPVPAVRVLCEDTDVIGQAFYVMDFVEGRIFEDPRLPGCTADDRARIYDDMNRVLAALHAIDPAEVGLEGFGRPHGYLARQISRWSQQYRASAVDDVPAMNSLMDWLAERAPDVADETAIAHGDYRPGNLLIHPTEARIIGVLDWELSTLGHPLADLAYNCQIYHLGARYPGPAMARADLAGMPSEADYLAAYCRRTGRDGIADWPVFLAFSFFRGAAIGAGVYRRGLDGNAADAQALERGALYKLFAEIGWDIAQGRAAAFL